MSDFLFNIIINIFWSTIIMSSTYPMLNTYLEKNKNWNFWKKTSLLLLVGMIHGISGIYIQYTFKESTLLRVLCFTCRAIVCFTTIMLPYSDKKTKKAFFALFNLAIFATAEAFAVAIYLFRMEFYETGKLSADGITVISILSGVIVYVFVFIIHLIRKKREPISKPAKQYALESIILLLSIISLCFNAIYADRNSMIFYSVFIVMLNITVFAIFEKLEKYYNLNQEYALKEQQDKLREEYYQQMETYQKEIRIIKHDLKNQLIAIGATLQENNETHEEIREMIDKLSADDLKQFTIHPGVNALLSSKFKEARENKIFCDFDVKLPADVKIKNNDLAALLGNILDNAIEACRYCIGKPYIRLRIAYHNNSIIVTCENSNDMKHLDLQTRKKDKFNHGLGLQSVKSIVNKYKGELQWEFLDHHFHLELTVFD